MFDIVAVDDELTITRFLESFFKINEIKGKTFNCTNEAMDFIVENPVKILMTDINMPAKCGITFAKEIKQIKPDIFLLAFTGSMDIDSAELQLFEKVIEKPCSIDLLSEIIKGFIKKSEVEYISNY